MSKRQKFTPEFRAEAVELALSSDRSLKDVGSSLGLNEGTLGNWVRKYRIDHPEESDRNQGPVAWAQFEKLQREMAEVKREDEFLKAVSAYFAAERKR